MTSDVLGRLSAALYPRYTLLGEIGRGGMATVYRARDQRRERDVAVKVLDRDLASEVDPERFAREIRIAKSLSHPSILPLLDSGEAEGCLFYVMPLVEGESLRERMERESQLAVEDTLRIARKVAEGLDYAHARGVVHRDIKPENILLDGDDVFLTDFGIARMLTRPGGDRVTATGHAVGTPAYVSPEQSEAGRKIDGRCDVYSLGCVIHEMLAGEPPFTGPTTQAVIARHLAAPAPSLDVVRPELPPSVVASVRKALAKVPADRFVSAGALCEALEATGAVRTPDRDTARWKYAAAGAAALLAGAAAWVGIRPSPDPALDPYKVVVFPLASARAQGDPEDGWNVALALGGALEHTEPLKFIDGWTWLDPERRRDPASLTPRDARAVSAERGAGHYIAGAIRAEGDSLSVILRLHDVTGDSLVAQETASGPLASASLANLGLAAIPRILARLVDPGQPVDLAALTQRAPAAIALSIQGDREYRQAHFREALGFYERAVDEDSLHALAAIRGAQAASWSVRFQDAERLIGRALRHDSLLAPRYRSFARGLHARYRGRADEAVEALGEALDSDPDWSEANTALGEVYYHLLPDDEAAARPDSAARHWFAASWETDSTFAPPLYHLAEIALRAGEPDEARTLIARWRPFAPDTVLLRQLEHSLACLEEEPDGFDWSRALERGARPVLQAGMSLAGGARQVACARGALEAVYTAEVPVSFRWTAVNALHGLAMAQGRYEEADSLVGDAVDQGIREALTLHVYGSLAGGPFQVQAGKVEEALRRATGELYGSSPPEWRWLMGAWLARTAEVDRLAALTRDMERQAREGEGGEEIGTLARAVRAHLTLAGGDTASAIAQLQELRATAPGDQILFEGSASLAVERMLLADLLLATGRPAAAYRVAALLDHPAPLAYLRFLPRSLALRARAGDAMSRPHMAEVPRARLERLGWKGPEAPFSLPQ